MLDLLDKQILETINSSPSLVRSITEEEVRRGVLLPSVTTIDIKRNLPRSVDIKIVEGRLRVLENEGHIYYENGRWWLTTKGRDALGISPTQPSSGSMRRVLDETFAKYEDREEHSQVISSELNQLVQEINHARNELLESTRLQERDETAKPEYDASITNITKQLNQIDRKLRELTSKRKEILQKEIDRLESDLTMKRKELNDLEGVREEA
jgi:chromosome segregation ATPase